MFEDDLAITNRLGQGKRVENPCGAMMEGELFLNGKVIGEFVCDNIDTYDDDTIFAFRHEDYTRWNDFDLNRACVHPEEFQNYANGEWLYGWHISNLIIYDKPKELSEFYKYCGDNPDCNGCEAHYYSNTECGLEDCCCSKIYGCRPINRPPQSWCYIETLN